MSVINCTQQKRNPEARKPPAPRGSHINTTGGRTARAQFAGSMRNPVITLLVLTAAVQPSWARLTTSYIVDVIRQVNDVYHFRTFPIFTRHIRRFSDFPEKLAQECLVPQIIIRDNSTQRLKDTIDRNAFPIIFTGDWSGDLLNFAVEQLRGMHLAKTLFVLTNPVPLSRQPYFLMWLWKVQFINVLFIFDNLEHRSQVFSLDPFPLRWVNLTSFTDASKLFVKTSNNWMGYEIHVPFIEDVPRVFPFKKNGKISMAGKHATIMTLFAKHVNISLVTNYRTDMDLSKLLLEFHSKDMILSVHSFPRRDLKGMGSSYPLEAVRWCVMVPLRSEVPKSEYVVIAFDRATWLVACISVVYIALLMRYIDPPQENTQKWYFLRSMALLIYSPNMAERMYAPTVRQFAFFGLVYLLGFILSCIYLTYLTSFCTNMVFQPPIDTVDDLRKDHLRIMVIDYELPSIRETQTFGPSFLELLYPVSYFELLKHRNNFDGRYAYTIRQDRWHFLDKQQRGLKKKFFRLSEICFGRQYVVFPLQYDSYLAESLNHFILYVQQSGLDVFWDEDAFRKAVEMDYSKNLVEKTVIIQQLRLDYFKYVFAAFAVGVFLSLVCFAAELAHKKIADIKRELQRIREL